MRFKNTTLRIAGMAHQNVLYTPTGEKPAFCCLYEKICNSQDLVIFMFLLEQRMFTGFLAC